MSDKIKQMNDDLSAGSNGSAGRYLAFKLGGELFALEILGVQEIIGLTPIRSVPKAPDYVGGIINLRGKVIPVISLRSCFGMEHVEPTVRTCIIILKIARWGVELTMGVLVDEVTEVLDIEEGATEPIPEFGSEAAADFIKGVGKVDGRIVMILDADKLLPGEEVDALNKLT